MSKFQLEYFLVGDDSLRLISPHFLSHFFQALTMIRSNFLSLFRKLLWCVCGSPLTGLFRAGAAVILVAPSQVEPCPASRDALRQEPMRWNKLPPLCSCHCRCLCHPELFLRCMDHVGFRRFVFGSLPQGSAGPVREGAGLSHLGPCPWFLAECLVPKVTEKALGAEWGMEM